MEQYLNYFTCKCIYFSLDEGFSVLLIFEKKKLNPVCPFLLVFSSDFMSSYSHKYSFIFSVGFGLQFVLFSSVLWGIKKHCLRHFFILFQNYIYLSVGSWGAHMCKSVHNSIKFDLFIFFSSCDAGDRMWVLRLRRKSL